MTQVANQGDRRAQIRQHVALEKQVTPQDSELLDQILELTADLSPLAKQRLAMQLLGEVAREAL